MRRLALSFLCQPTRLDLTRLECTGLDLTTRLGSTQHDQTTTTTTTQPTQANEMKSNQAARSHPQTFPPPQQTKPYPNQTKLNVICHRLSTLYPPHATFRHHQHTKNNNQRTMNNEQRTTNDEQRTTNDERLTNEDGTLIRIRPLRCYLFMTFYVSLTVTTPDFCIFLNVDNTFPRLYASQSWTTEFADNCSAWDELHRIQWGNAVTD